MNRRSAPPRRSTRRTSRPLASVVGTDALPEAGTSTSTLQAKLTYQQSSTDPSTDTDVKVTCELYSTDPSTDTDAKVIFTTPDPEDVPVSDGTGDASIAISPMSTDPSTDTDGAPHIVAAALRPVVRAARKARSVVVEVHIPPRRSAQSAGTAVSSPALTPLANPFRGDRTEPPALAAPGVTSAPQ